MNSSKSWIKCDLSFGSQHCLKIFWCGFDDPSFLRPIFGATCHSTAIPSGLLGESLHFQWWGEERASRGTHFFKILRRERFWKIVLVWLVKGCWDLLTEVVHFITWWTSHESIWWRTFVGEIGFTSSESCARRVTSSWALTWMWRRFCWMAIKSKQPRSFATKVPISNAPGLTGWFWWILRLSLAPVACTTHCEMYKQNIAQRYIYI